jgi:hypothetical protein
MEKEKARIVKQRVVDLEKYRKATSNADPEKPDPNRPAP